MTLHMQVIKFRVGKATIEPTTAHPGCHYGQPVFPGIPTLRTGQCVGVLVDMDVEPNCPPPPARGYDAYVEWTDGLWSILRVPDYDCDYIAIHHESGFAGQVTCDTGNKYWQLGPHSLDYDAPTRAIRREIRQRISAGTIRVDGTIQDWTRETLALLPF